MNCSEKKRSKGRLWQSFPKVGLSAEGARARFVHRFGYPPAEVLDAGTMWLVGPVVLVADPQPPLPGFDV